MELLAIIFDTFIFEQTVFEKSPLDSTNDDKKPCVPYGTHPTTPNFLKHPTTEELKDNIQGKTNQMTHPSRFLEFKN